MYGRMTKEKKLLGLLAPIDLQVEENKATVLESDESVTNFTTCPCCGSSRQK